MNTRNQLQPCSGKWPSLCDPRTPIARGIEGRRLQTRIEPNIEMQARSVLSQTYAWRTTASPAPRFPACQTTCGGGSVLSRNRRLQRARSSWRPVATRRFGKRCGPRLSRRRRACSAGGRRARGRRARVCQFQASDVYGPVAHSPDFVEALAS